MVEDCTECAFWTVLDIIGVLGFLSYSMYEVDSGRLEDGTEFY